jgi:hypothetical protein
MTDLEPDSDPTPVYKGIGIVLMLCSVALTGYAFVVGRSIDRWTAAVIALPILTTLILWRPKWVKWAVETAADKLPFVRFTKPAP